MKRPNNCKTCGGKMQDGGSFGKAFSSARKAGLKVFDWNGKKYTTELKEETQAPINSDNSNRLKSVLRADDNRKPSTKAPTKPVDTNQFTTSRLGFKATDGTGTSVASITRPKPSQKSAPKEANYADTQGLESGVIVDKGTNQAYVVKNGKVQKQFNVLTGQNPQGEKLAKSIKEQEVDVKARNTPQGDYFMQPDNFYGYKGFGMKPLFGDNPGNLAVHTTYNPEYRNQFYGTDKANQSYGCVNCENPNIDLLYKEFPKGDTLRVINSKMGMAANKQVGGYAGDEECYDPATGYPIPCDKIPSSLFRPSNIISSEDVPYVAPERKPSPYLDRVEEGIDQGVLEAKRDDVHAGDTQRTTNQQYWDYKGIPEARRLPGTPLNWKRNLGIGMMGVRSLLSEISGRVARSRQNEYDYAQQAMLGKLNPMKPQQPNAYSLYSKYGGKLKDYMKYGGLQHHNYFGPKFSNKASYKFSEREQFDKVVVTRSIVPDLILRKNWGNKRIYRK